MKCAIFNHVLQVSELLKYRIIIKYLVLWTWRSVEFWELKILEMREIKQFIYDIFGIIMNKVLLYNFPQNIPRPSPSPSRPLPWGLAPHFGNRWHNGWT
jgi:hypothetical protein